MPAYHEICRPKSFAEIAGQDGAVSRVQSLLSRSWGGRAWWIQGASGTGKTSIARLIASQGAEALYVEEIVARDLTVSEFDRITRGHCFHPLAGQGHCVIVNEVHGLSRAVKERMLQALDPVGENVCWVFTTTNQAQTSLFEDDQTGDNAALLSRCTVIKLADDAKARKAMAERARTLAMRDNMDGLPIEAYTHALNSRQGNMRALLGDVESGRIEELYQERTGMERELDMIRATKGQKAEDRREELKRLLS